MHNNKILFEAIRAMPEEYVHDATALSMTYRQDGAPWQWCAMRGEVSQVVLVGLVMANPNLPPMFYSLGDNDRQWQEIQIGDPQQSKIEFPVRF